MLAAMNTTRKITLALMALILVLPLSINAAEYKAGQVWKYKTRPGEEGSLLYIVKIDNEKGYGNIYHIYVDGLKIRNTRIKGGIQSQLPHAPVNEKTLTESVTNLVRERGNMPDISEGYEVWRKSFDTGHAGVFNIPVIEIIGLIEDTVNKAQPDIH